ncbi:spore germination protein KC [Paenibacillus cellulosilyticus]|uniref:Spore germination protein KC n=1 Tax=Paenibacillus cellulosilyticus TaxID=375489 RepID=A0A2V2YXT6_9BACL|nr:Ger(x)C family spore germination protein [Paenibacillus cellulosilyticus]PWW06256.1 spore germination protein KC [Paenibacillus cellulosilyticus]QKS42992.1 Ger(x)C family spore germination protein [Paenibacillus cellulosilyticus]
MRYRLKCTVCCVLLLSLLCIVITGCGSRTELNEISIVSASGVDWKDGKWVMSYQLVLPQAISSHGMGNSTGAAPVNVFSTSGDTIRGAISKASYEMSRRLYFSQNQIIVVSEQAAEHGLTNLFDAYLRNPDSRETVSVFLTKLSARQVLEHLIPLEEIPGEAIERMSLNEEKNGSTLPHMSMYRVLLDLLGPTKATGVASIDISGEDPLNSMQKMSKTYSSSKIKLGQLGILREDKLAGWISHTNSYGVMWMRNQIRNSSLWFPCSSEQPAEQAVMRVNRTKTKLKAKKDGDSWKLHVQIRAKGTLLEYPCDSDLSKPASVEELEKAAAAKIAMLVQDSFKAVQGVKADILGFGEAVRLQYPKEWNAMTSRWNEEIFPETKVETDVQVTIERTGMSTDSFRKMQSKAGS